LAGLRPLYRKGSIGAAALSRELGKRQRAASTTLVGASPNSRLIEGERVCPKPCLGLLRGVLGLLAPLLGAALQCLELSLQVL
jgi:hypothetical protein